MTAGSFSAASETSNSKGPASRAFFMDMGPSSTSVRSRCLQVASLSLISSKRRADWCRRDQDLGIAVVEEVLQLVGRGHDVERHGHGAEFLAGKVGNGEFGDVGEHQGHLVPLADTEGFQVVGQGVYGPVQVLEADP